MITKDEVEQFLSRFHAKMKIFGIVFREDRTKNVEALAALDNVRNIRTTVIKNLRTEDYVQGPVDDMLNKLGEMWVFGKDLRGQEFYIKIMLGGENCQTICISFHPAERPLKYPFK